MLRAAQQVCHLNVETAPFKVLQVLHLAGQRLHQQTEVKQALRCPAEQCPRSVYGLQKKLDTVGDKACQLRGRTPQYWHR